MSLLKQWLPAWMKHWRRSDRGVVLYRSTNQNVYHCTVQKCASQWVRRLLSDPRTFQYCGLESYQYQSHLPGKYDPRKLLDRRFSDAFPDAMIATPIYVDFAGYATIPKPARYKTIFVMRDPRDVVVSWYFSSKLSHAAQGDIDRVRQELLRLSEADGLLYTIDYLAEFGLFAAQCSWADAPTKDANVLLIRYEDLIGAEQVAQVERMMMHADIRIPCADLEVLLRSSSFEELSGRKRGEEDLKAHYRKGIVGDWRNYFTEAIDRRFTAVAGDVLRRWNYS